MYDCLSYFYDLPFVASCWSYFKELLNFWNSFIFQFERTATRYSWTEKGKLDRLLGCLRDKAIDFVRTKPSTITSSYLSLSKALEDRFGQRDLPTTARRKLGVLKQLEDDSLEEFSDKIMDVVQDAHPDAPDSVLQDIAVDVFLKGVTNKTAATTAMDKDPKSLQEAVQMVRVAEHNRKALYGTMASKTYSSRKVSFETGDDKDCPLALRQVATTSSANSDRLARLEEQMGEIKEMLQKVLRPGTPTRSRSPARVTMTLVT